MAGPALAAPGGMSAVVMSYQQGDLFEAQNVAYLSTYETPGLVTQLRVFSKAWLGLLGMLLFGRVRLLHVHSASRGSFWRKSILCALVRLFGVPYVLHIHSGEFPIFVTQECGPLKRWWVTRTLQGAHRVIALTAHWQQELQRLAPGSRVVAIGNPVSFPSVEPVSAGNEKHIVFLGRLREKKGVFDLVKAMQIVLRTMPGALLTLAGDGDLPGVAASAKALGIDGKVVLPGWVDGAAKDALLAQAAVLVLPSYFEGLPICVLEAMALKIPVVATTVGGIPEALEWGACGSLVEPGDVNGLAAALIAQLAHSEAVLASTERAYNRVQTLYALPKILDQITAIYNDANSGNKELS